MEVLIIVAALLVIIWCWMTMHKSFTSDGTKIPDNSITVELHEVVIENNTFELSPPVYELEQWIRDNFKKIKVTKVQDTDYWMIESDLINCKLYDLGIDWPRYYIHHAGFSEDELYYLVNIYQTLVRERCRRITSLKEDRNRKQLARKLQNLGYGEGRYA